MNRHNAPPAVDLEKLKAFDTLHDFERHRTSQRAVAERGLSVRHGALPVSEASADGRLRGYGADPNLVAAHEPALLLRPYGLVELRSLAAGAEGHGAAGCRYTAGLGAFVGEIHATIGLALNCVGCVTNGAVRDLPPVEALGFQMYAQHTSVSHAYAHIIEFGEPVEIGGLKISSGDLLHGDRHGVLTIPLSIASEVPIEAAKIRQEERELIQFCRSPEFSLRELKERIQNMNSSCNVPRRP